MQRVKRVVWLLLAYMSVGWGDYLDTLIEKAMKSNPSLEVMQARLEASKKDIESAVLFKDPQLSLKFNALYSDELSQRSAERMQSDAVEIKQTLPFFGKRQTKEKIASASTALLQEEFRALQSKLASSIKKEVYTIWQLQAYSSIIDNFIMLTRQKAKLFESYTTTSNKHHMGLMSANLTLSNLLIDLSDLKADIAKSYAKLSYLVACQIDPIDINLTMPPMPKMQSFTQRLSQNSSYTAEQKSLQRSQAELRLSEQEYYPDITLQAGYYTREIFKDYLSVGISLSLPVYGKQGIEIEKRKALRLSQISKVSDTKLKLYAQLQQLYYTMQNAQNRYEIITKQSLPQLEHMFDLSGSSVSTGAGLFQYIDLLKQHLNIEKKRIQAIGDFHRARAAIGEIIGETR